MRKDWAPPDPADLRGVPVAGPGADGATRAFGRAQPPRTEAAQALTSAALLSDLPLGCVSALLERSSSAMWSCR